MATVYSIQHTDTNEPSFIINPSQIDGIGGPKSNSSLILHGTGRLKYGEALNENFLHLLENFSSPARAMPLVLSIQNADDNGGPGVDFVEIFDDKTNIFINGFEFQIVGSTSAINDNNYLVASSSYDQPSNLTTIILQGTLPDAQAAFVGNVSYNVVEPDPLMVIPPYNSGQLWFNKTDSVLYIYRDVSGTGTFQWDYAGRLGVTIDPPSFSNEGDLWYDQSIPQLKVYTGAQFVSVADRYVLMSGDTISPLVASPGFIGRTDGVLKFSDGNIDKLFINEGQGLVTSGPDIRAADAMLQTSDQEFQLNFDGNNDGLGSFIIAKGSHISTADNMFVILNNGTIIADTPNYETLVTFGNVIPNKQYVDDAIILSSGSLNFVTPNDLTTALASYVLTPVLNGYVLKSGDIMSGVLQINTTGITLGSGDSSIAGDGNFGLLIDTSTGTDTGGILIKTGDDDDDEHAIELVNHLGERKYIMQSKSGDQLIYGDTVHQTNSRLFLSQEPISNPEAATKLYVDNSIGSVSSIPVSTVVSIPTSSIPSGFLKCNGSAVSRTTYSTLFGIISTSYGTGNGLTTFNLPDLRGEFIRGWDDARGIDSGRAIGTAQADDLKSHTHGINLVNEKIFSSGDGARNYVNGTGTNDLTSATGGTETRPRNIAMMYAIKY